MILLRDFTSPIVAGFTADSTQFDTSPNQITGQTITGAALFTVTEFAAVQITGINAPVVASITNGQMRVSVDGVTFGAYSASNQTVEVNYWVQIRATSSALNSTNVDAVLSVGGVSALFRLRTISDTPADIQVDNLVFVQPGAAYADQSVTAIDSLGVDVSNTAEWTGDTVDPDAARINRVNIGTLVGSVVGARVAFTPSGTLPPGTYKYEAKGRDEYGNLITFATGTYTVTA